MFATKLERSDGGRRADLLYRACLVLALTASDAWNTIDRMFGRSGILPVTGDPRIDDIVQIIADDPAAEDRLGGYRCSPTGRYCTKRVPGMARDKTKLGGGDTEFLFHVRIGLARAGGIDRILPPVCNRPGDASEYRMETEAAYRGAGDP